LQEEVEEELHGVIQPISLEATQETDELSEQNKKYALPKKTVGDESH
jgi:hypothetical protein